MPTVVITVEIRANLLVDLLTQFHLPFGPLVLPMACLSREHIPGNLKKITKSPAFSRYRFRTFVVRIQRLNILSFHCPYLNCEEPKEQKPHYILQIHFSLSKIKRY